MMKIFKASLMTLENMRYKLNIEQAFNFSVIVQDFTACKSPCQVVTTLFVTAASHHAATVSDITSRLIVQHIQAVFPVRSRKC